jgi:type IV secretory pathway VirB4 component
MSSLAQALRRRVLTPPLGAHAATSAQLRGAYPFLVACGLPASVYIGRDSFGGAFCFDAFDLVEQGLLTGPAMIVLGEIGRGKSTLVKAYLHRQIGVFGRRAVVVSPKRGEYDRLAEALGCQPLRLRPGGTLRLNPLEAPPGLEPRDAFERVLRAARGVARATLGRDLEPAEDAALGACLREPLALGGTITLPAVVATLLDPPALAWQGRWRDREQWLAETRALALSLDRLVEGDARGMFDAPTTSSVDLAAPLVVVDLSEVADRAAIAILMTATLAWIHAQVARESDAEHAKRIVVCDEAWRVLSSEAGAEALLDATKHSRAYGIQPITITHKISDLAASGDAGSRLSRISDGLLADAETRVVFAQPGDELAAARERLGLSDEEVALLPRLRRGEALWRIGNQRRIVRIELSEREAWICDTDQRMRSTPAATA